MGGGYTYMCLEDVLMWMGKNCENCHWYRSCPYCGFLWEASITHYLGLATAEIVGITSSNSICKLKA